MKGRKYRILSNNNKVMRIDMRRRGLRKDLEKGQKQKCLDLNYRKRGKRKGTGKSML